MTHTTHMTPVLEARKLGKRYGRHPALTDIDLAVPPGRVIGLVGPNGAGKSTLLQLACGLITPSSGTIRVLGETPAAGPAHLAKVGFVAQDTPLYADLSVADHLKMGARLNPGWDPVLARRRLDRIDLDPRRKAGRLSGGQRAQLALTIAAAKRPELLIFDEPAAALDPLARHAFLDHLLESVTDLGASAILSSHALPDIERVCDHLIILAGSRVQLAGDVTRLLADHVRVTAHPSDLLALPATAYVVTRTDPSEREGSAATALVRAADRALLADGPWTTTEVGLEELALAYLNRADRGETRPSLSPYPGRRPEAPTPTAAEDHR
ncbi:ABC transporter ATP-binding protein [Streptomyces sp. NBC_00536]|uniref:ABC transporter ATP-binding protein n=1 Tax=Streptomyces sp. NBC_00536 TaxID=2975769 RepID=UPI002E807DFD|nr:ABC transporter ATP-binding protein [Streptomyces sp. NBC_00536]WUC83178.1 ABC transporter ATP-binding protein [Streptomyces sp. NBC_00536]